MITLDQFRLLQDKNYTSFLHSLESLEDLPDTFNIRFSEIISDPLLYLQWKIRHLFSI